jgi:hypothetical protein
MSALQKLIDPWVFTRTWRKTGCSRQYYFLEIGLWALLARQRGFGRFGHFCHYGSSDRFDRFGPLGHFGRFGRLSSNAELEALKTNEKVAESWTFWKVGFSPMFEYWAVQSVHFRSPFHTRCIHCWSFCRGWIVASQVETGYAAAPCPQMSYILVFIYPWVFKGTVAWDGFLA